DGLAAAHSVALVHRDLKPENILLTQDSRALVSDFGLALSNENSEANVFAGEGTPNYMAPEQKAGKAADARSDQFAFCLTFREAVADRPLPSWLSKVIERGLEPDPNARFASISHLSQAIIRGQSGRRRRHIALSALAGLLALGAVTFWAGARLQH